MVKCEKYETTGYELSGHYVISKDAGNFRQYLTHLIWVPTSLVVG